MVKNLNFKGHIMDLLTALAEVGRSSKEYRSLAILLDNVDKHNMFSVNISEFCKKHSINQSNFSQLIKRATNIGLMRRIERGVYMVNPLLFKSKGSSNKEIEEAQAKWEEA